MSASEGQILKRKRSESVASQVEAEAASPLENQLLPAAELEASEQGQSLPLTKENLKLHTATASISSESEEDAESDSMSKSSTNSMPYNINEVETFLRNHGLFHEANTTSSRFPALKAMAQKQFLHERSSPMKPEEIEHVKHEIGVSKTKNENTFLTYFWTALIKVTRTRTINGKTRSVYFSEDGVIGIWDHQFHANALFDVSTLDAKAKKLLKDFPRLATPKPDIAFGFDKDSFTYEEGLIIDKFADYSRVCPLSVAVFFIVEAKVASSSIGFAVHQASRGGAALVRANKRLNDHAGFTSNKNPPNEDRNIVMSLALDNRSAILCIHWVETTAEDGDLYHSHIIKEYLFSHDEDIVALRRDVDNVLDWGALTRRNQVKQLIAVLKTKDRLPSLAEEAEAAKQAEAAAKAEAEAEAKSEASGKSGGHGRKQSTQQDSAAKKMATGPAGSG